MYSREESKRIRQDFWIDFGKQSLRKWILYNTKIKELQLKFTFTTEVAQVSMDISSTDEIIRAYYWEKLISLKSILLSEYLPEAIFEEQYHLPEGKVISRLYVQMEDVNIHRKKDWSRVQEFLCEMMSDLERFFLEFEDYIKD